jgi:hypothetical protein
MVFYIQHGPTILAEVESTSPFTATCGIEAELAPEGSILVELETGIVCAHKTALAGNLIAWSFAHHLAFDDEAATSQHRSVA